MPSWAQGSDGLSDENSAPGAVNVCQTCFRSEGDKESLPSFLMRSGAAEPVLPQSMCMPPGTYLVEGPSVSEDSERIQGAGRWVASHPSRQS